MHTVIIENGFDEWREQARKLLTSRVPPEEILWEREAGLFSDEPPLPPAQGETPTVPKEFLKLAHTVAHHASPSKWALLYLVLWRLTHGGERHLLKMASDLDLVKLAEMRKAIQRDIHKMHAFVRFQKVGEDAETGREQFVSWFEPDHEIMPLTAGFFRKRFTGMDWSIFTPTGSASWDGKEVRLGPGVERMDAPGDDELENLWRSYYKSIFNPARIKVKAMQAEMPKKYWKNLPEADLIEELIAEGKDRVSSMMEVEERPARLLNNAYLNRLGDLTAAQENPQTFREQMACCRNCPLWENATGTVLPEGPENARIMVIGEQPGDQEDLTGRPFVGPAGKLLDRFLAQAGIDRKQVYLTNAVKHFKFKRQGKLRLHQNPSVGEMKACRPWVMSEILRVQPKVIITLGATAAKSIIDPAFKITQQRGLIDRPDLAPKVVATVHPSYLLRSDIPGEEERFLADLMLAR